MIKKKVWKKRDIDNLLKIWLGTTYGGPSVSYENEKFVLYRWHDAPVGMDIIAEGDSLEDLVENYLEKK